MTALVGGAGLLGGGALVAGIAGFGCSETVQPSDVCDAVGEGRGQLAVILVPPLVLVLTASLSRQLLWIETVFVTLLLLEALLLVVVLVWTT
jgi:hypothetical protein